MSLPLILQIPVDKTILAGGGFSDATQIESCNPNTDTSHLEGLSWGGRYEGVPPVNNQASSNFVVLQDTDVAVLLFVSDNLECLKIWIKR